MTTIEYTSPSLLGPAQKRQPGRDGPPPPPDGVAAPLPGEELSPGKGAEAGHPRGAADHEAGAGPTREGGPPPGPDPKRLAELLQRARLGDPAVLPALRAALDADASLWRTHGDLAANAQEHWLVLLSDKNLLVRESLRRQLAALRDELRGPDPSPMERLLVDHVVECWLQVQVAEGAYAKAHDNPAATTGVWREMQKRLDLSQRRYLAAIKQLTQSKKSLKRPRPSLGPATKARANGPKRKEASCTGGAAGRLKSRARRTPVRA
jgi:hypothetical protein